MCYDVKALLKAQLKRYKGTGVPEHEIREKIQELGGLDFYHTTGFSHPKLLVYKNSSPHVPVAAAWGLIPHWVKDKSQMLKLRNSTINARVETIFEKPAFRDSARSHRCLITVNGFYEHHHYRGKSYPYYIYPKHNDTFTFAGLWSDWTDQKSGEIISSFTIITTKANRLMTEIHNAPKLSEPRMPLILDESIADEWLKPITGNSDRQHVQDLIQPYSTDKISAHTVRKLRGNTSVINARNASDAFQYPELSSGGLFG